MTVTTVGYGDKTCVTSPGRLIGTVWIVLGVVLFSILSGAMTTAFADIRSSGDVLSTVPDLISANIRVCSYGWLFDEGELLETIPLRNQVKGLNMEDCAESLRHDPYAAIVIDSSIAKRWRAMNDRGAIRISSDLNWYFISFMIPEASVDANLSQWAHATLSPAITDWTRTHHYSSRLERWFPEVGAGAGRPRKGSYDHGYDATLYGPAIALIVAYLALIAVNSVKRRNPHIHRVLTSAEKSLVLTGGNTLGALAAVVDVVDGGVGTLNGRVRYGTPPASAVTSSGLSSGLASLDIETTVPDQ